MKKQIALALVALTGILALNSCGGGGWTDLTKGLTRTGCEIMVSDYDTTDAKAICDCYMTKIVEKYPDGMIGENENDSTITACKSGYKTMTEMKMEEMANDTAHVDTLTVQ